MIIIVPDVHGRSFWKRLLKEKIDPGTTIVFLGDYIDPYPRDGVTPEDAIEGLKEVIEFAKNNSNVVLLLGNHDGQYIDLSRTVSRFSFEHSHEIFNLFYDNRDLFRLAYMEGNVVFTHAGITRTWLNSHGLEENPENLVKYLNSFSKYISSTWIMEVNPYDLCLTDGVPIRDVGRVRGGYAASGSPIWADIEELLAAPAFKDLGYYQICGHTQLRDTGTFIHRDNFWMVDSREIFVYDNCNIKVL